MTAGHAVVALRGVRKEFAQGQVVALEGIELEVKPVSDTEREHVDIASGYLSEQRDMVFRIGVRHRFASRGDRAGSVTIFPGAGG